MDYQDGVHQASHGGTQNGKGVFYLSDLNDTALVYKKQTSQSLNVPVLDYNIHTQAQPFKHTLYFQYVTRKTELCAKHHDQITFQDSTLYKPGRKLFGGHHHDKNKSLLELRPQT